MCAYANVYLGMRLLAPDSPAYFVVYWVYAPLVSLLFLVLEARLQRRRHARGEYGVIAFWQALAFSGPRAACARACGRAGAFRAGDAVELELKATVSSSRRGGAVASQASWVPATVTGVDDARPGGTTRTYTVRFGDGTAEAGVAARRLRRGSRAPVPTAGGHGASHTWFFGGLEADADAAVDGGGGGNGGGEDGGGTENGGGRAAVRPRPLRLRPRALSAPEQRDPKFERVQRFAADPGSPRLRLGPLDARQRGEAHRAADAIDRSIVHYSDGDGVVFVKGASAEPGERARQREGALKAASQENERRMLKQTTADLRSALAGKMAAAQFSVTGKLIFDARLPRCADDELLACFRRALRNLGSVNDFRLVEAAIEAHKKKAFRDAARRDGRPLRTAVRAVPRDAAAALRGALVAAGLLGDHEQSGARFPRSFLASDAVQVMVAERLAEDEPSATRLGTELLHAGLIACVAGSGAFMNEHLVYEFGEPGATASLDPMKEDEEEVVEGNAAAEDVQLTVT